MKYYLSSYGTGDHTDQLQKLLSGSQKRVAFIPNSLDFSDDEERKDKSNQKIIDQLTQLGFHVDILDLQEYFGKKDTLADDLEGFDGVFVRGGNVFVLRQAMQLSGFDELMWDYEEADKDFLYAGFSAGVCVLAPSLRGIELVDTAEHAPYGDYKPIIQGLGLLDYLIIPHYHSQHEESSEMDKVIEYCIENKILFKALADGEVLIHTQG